MGSLVAFRLDFETTTNENIFRKTHSRGLPVVVALLDVHLALGTRNRYGYRKYNIFFRFQDKSTMMAARDG